MKPRIFTTAFSSIYPMIDLFPECVCLLAME